MGIPSYFSHILKNHSSIIKELNAHMIDNLFLDSNSIIYDVVNNLQDHILKDLNDIIIQKVIEKINEYISVVSPQGIIMISFDGVAPLAKLDQQRERRFKSSYTKLLSCQLGLSANKWDTCNITPGTYFMEELDRILHLQYEKYPNILLSTSNERGEGEHKIFQYIRNNPKIWKQKNIIYGLDADLIMLALNHSHLSPKIFLLRESPHFIQSFQSELIPNKLYLLDIQDFADKLVLELQPTNKNNKRRIISDYIFLCFLLGNDFLPHFPSLNLRTTGIFTLLDHYKEFLLSQKLYLTNKDKIQWKNVSKLLNALALKEEDLILEELEKRDKLEWKIKQKLRDSDNATILKRVENMPILDRRIEKEIHPKNKDWKSNYYNLLFPMKFTSIEEIAKNYLEGLEWTFLYYQSDCKNWRWKYSFSYPPLLCDLMDYIPKKNISLITENEESISKLTQLAYVLPKSSLHLLPPKVLKKLDKNVYTQDCTHKWAFCKYYWESHVDLPEIDIDELSSSIDKIIGKGKND